MAWLDLSGQQKIKPDEFWFGLSYFSANVSVELTSILFDFLDKSQDGCLSQSELASLMQQRNEFMGSQRFSSTGKYINSIADELDLPVFSRARIEKSDRVLAGGDFGHKEELKFIKLRQKLNDKPSRKL